MSGLTGIQAGQSANETGSEEAAKRGKRKAAAAEEVNLSTPLMVEPGPSHRGAALSLPNARKVPEFRPTVLFTGYLCYDEDQVVQNLGGTITDNVSECTLIVTRKLRRTRKLYCGVASGKPIVNLNWILMCRWAKTFVEHTPFLLRDREAEKTVKFVLVDTLRKVASQGGLLRGWRVHSTPHVRPPRAALKEIVTYASGTYLEEMPTRSTGGPTVIVSCQEDLKACMQAKQNGVPVVSVEFVLNGILRYSLDFGAYRLS